jgi:GNAT superfamily N-acetyltransferase
MSFRHDIHPDAPVRPERACAIRRGAPDDAEALSAFATRTFVDTYGAYNHPDNLRLHLAASYAVARQRDELGDPGIVTLLAHRGGALAAFAQVRRSAPPACVACDAAVELHRFYVDRTWHGQGVSHALLAEVRRAARSFDAATLWLKVWERNPRAIAFYAKSRFVDVGVTDFFVGNDRQTDRVLVLDLRDAYAENPFAGSTP